MFTLANIDRWYQPSRGISDLAWKGNFGVLKAIGYAHVIQLIRSHPFKSILEFGHGANSPLFDMFENDVEMWGLDEHSGHGTECVASEHYVCFRGNHSRSRFLVGLLGKGKTNLPDEYFDLVCSVSVIEHIPEEDLPAVLEEIARVLKPGGLVVNSYDLCYGQDAKPFFDAHVRAGLEWLNPEASHKLDWSAQTVAFEDPRVVMDYYMSYLPEEERRWPGNFATCISAARKPLNPPLWRRSSSQGTSVSVEQPTVPRISLVLPNYNSGAVLERALKSIVQQHYPNLQLILVDAASTDESGAIIRRYRHACDVVICEKDDGQADGINKGFRWADGDIHGWLCADDELLPGALHHVAEMFDKHPAADILTGRCERIFADGLRYVVPPDPEAWDKIGMRNVIEQPSTFWRAAIHNRVGELDKSYQLVFDWDLWARIHAAGGKLITTDAILSRYHFSDQNKSGSAGDLHAEEGFRVVHRHGPMKGLVAHVYRFLYRHFDLKGCMDKVPSRSMRWLALYGLTRLGLRLILGSKALNLYNLHFASLQQRGIVWWR